MQALNPLSSLACPSSAEVWKPLYRLAASQRVISARASAGGGGAVRCGGGSGGGGAGSGLNAVDNGGGSRAEHAALASKRGIHTAPAAYVRAVLIPQP